jgi:hypothetical protein
LLINQLPVRFRAPADQPHVHPSLGRPFLPKSLKTKGRAPDVEKNEQRSEESTQFHRVMNLRSKTIRWQQYRARSKGADAFQERGISFSHPRLRGMPPWCAKWREWGK